MKTLRNKIKQENETFGGGPPDSNSISRKELFNKLSKREMPSEVVDFRTNNGEVFKIRICVLKYEEHESCRVMAANELKEKYKGADIPDAVYQDAVALHILLKTIKEVEPDVLQDGRKIYYQAFDSVDQIRKVLTADEVVTLFNLYQLTQEKLNPNESMIWIDDNFDKWVQALAEGSSDFLAALPLPYVAKTITEMARIIISNGQLGKLHNIMELPPAKSNSDTSSLQEPVVSHFTKNEPKILSKEEALDKINKVRNKQ